jgi:hypothetical protein
VTIEDGGEHDGLLDDDTGPCCGTCKHLDWQLSCTEPLSPRFGDECEPDDAACDAYGPG